MVKGAKDLINVKGDYMSIRVIIPKKTYKALKVKCNLIDKSVQKGIIDLVEKWVKDVKREIVDKYPKG